ncbi:non-hydrolyzing UDP-N-acetylglucosamine 2-epimerase [Maridesulfovibrio hydrothermalis]|uniref:UDP-N-acetylglucosamine 2-epimerase homolog n=1 Tax=Maridesulfovibrio hydrothermalis AM13 = DSM 14728 TaxID=1121451 RepID=L0R7C4_9BACT|nr:UDP-N-acetylglucosamine 2-epimerase (non-hydrolyzing) [Maridesulfovibrio hydrothermalis]CCO22639.1 UDP-N-acetylglucosamine 2-epimerase homolog [Maridesulfovibrio hydrothermalis AM13 = DSM 14728]
MKICSLVGARPQFIKEALISSEVIKNNEWNHIVIHSGQHYDFKMSDIFFSELNIPKPAYNLGVGSGSHAEMTAAALTGVEQVLLKEQPDGLIVYGDTNTTLAGALAAAKLDIPVIHIEAGIRQNPKSMPEEINRGLTDKLSSILCCCSDIALSNLKRENIEAAASVTGDIMYDLFMHMYPKFSPEKQCSLYGVEPQRFIVATIHRDFNTDNSTSLKEILTGLNELKRSTNLEILFPIHPRTTTKIKEFGLTGLLENLTMLSPLGYIDLMSLVCASSFVVTDSGGLQKEAYYANCRAIVIMPDTGWRELVQCGWNLLCAADRNEIVASGKTVLSSCPKPAPLYGDGSAAVRIVKFIKKNLIS